MSDEPEPDYEFPPQWARRGEKPPVRTTYKPAPRSGLGYIGNEPQADNSYPPDWGPPNRDHQ